MIIYQYIHVDNYTELNRTAANKKSLNYCEALMYT